MLKPNVEKALNNQINEEMFSSYLYLSMAAHFESKSLLGFANWMRVQVQEEYFHGMKIFDYVSHANGIVTLAAVKEPKIKWESVLEVFEETLVHEEHITDLINNLTALALKEGDHATHSFLQWFVDEQVEELSNAKQLVEELKMIGNDKSGLFLLDRELKTRPPAMTFTVGQQTP